jgi:hypothetical protein
MDENKLNALVAMEYKFDSAYKKSSNLNDHKSLCEIDKHRNPAQLIELEEAEFQEILRRLSNKKKAKIRNNLSKIQFIVES